MTAPNGSNNAIPAGTGLIGNIVSPTPSSGQGIVLQSGTPEGAAYVSTEGQRKTFRFGANAVLAATPSDVFQILGSATSTIRIHKLRVSGLAATALQDIEVIGVRRSTAAVGGTPVAVTPVSMDILNDGTVTGAALNTFTANPGTLGTSIGNIADVIVPFDLKTGANATAVDVISPSDANTKPITLHGTADAFCLNLNGVTLANATTIYVDGIYSEDIS